MEPDAGRTALENVQQGADTGSVSLSLLRCVSVSLDVENTCSLNATDFLPSSMAAGFSFNILTIGSCSDNLYCRWAEAKPRRPHNFRTITLIHLLVILRAQQQKKAEVCISCCFQFTELCNLNRRWCTCHLWTFRRTVRRILARHWFQGKTSSHCIFKWYEQCGAIAVCCVGKRRSTPFDVNFAAVLIQVRGFRWWFRSRFGHNKTRRNQEASRTVQVSSTGN